MRSNLLIKHLCQFGGKLKFPKLYLPLTLCIFATITPCSGQNLNNGQNGSVLEESEYHFVPTRNTYLSSEMADGNYQSYNDLMRGTSTLLRRSQESLRYSESAASNGIRGGVSARANHAGQGLEVNNLNSLVIDPRFLHVNVGPFVLDQFLLGGGAFWVDENGFVPNSNGDDGWGGLIWASMRMSVLLSDDFIVSLRPSVYWSFEDNKVGWMFNPLATGLRPNVLGELRYDFDIGNWHFKLYDQLGVAWAAGRFATFPTMQTSSQSIIDQVGRYGFSMNGEMSDWDIATRFSMGDWQDYVRYYNWGGITAETMLTDTIQLQALFNKIDIWDYDLNGIRSRIHGGVWLSAKGPNFEPYIGYQMTSGEPYDLFLHQFHAGANFNLLHNLRGFVGAGYMWKAGPNIDADDTWLGIAGLDWQMTGLTRHYIAGGRRVVNTAFLPISLDDFVEYRLTQQVGFSSEAAFIVGTSQRKQVELTRGGGDAHVNYVGLTLLSQISETVIISAVAGYENIDRGRQDVQRWTYRLNADASLSPSVGLQAFYQYSDTSGTINFSEHALFMSMTKRF
jgi:hypothetical protein